VENRKIVRMQGVNPAALPTSYSQNGDEELLVLEYIENFRRQFVQLYPDRKELLLCPRNECGLEKFICTTIRPTKLEYNELYDLEACAFFVAEHIQYEALQDETQLPRYVPSPSSVLKWQIGDCIDMSILLASFLLGVGYDAYVVIGYADKTTCLADETNSAVPALKEQSKMRLPPGSAAGKAAEGVAPGYEVKLRPVLDSDFVMRHDKLVRLDERLVGDEKAPEKVADSEEEEKVAEDDLHGQRIHCWVLVRAGKREMAQDVFIEASTGKATSTDNPAYLGIEAVLNHQNYWVDFQRCSAVRDMSFDLDDFTKWEFIFMQSTVTSALKAEGDEEEDLGRDKHKTKGAAKEEVGVVIDTQGAEEIRESDHILDLPPSWVAKLHIDREDYLQRFAKENDETKLSKDYRRSRAELFAENSRKDGMVQRLTLYSDLARTSVREEQEVYANRKDKLVRRIRFYQPGIRIEAGRSESLIEESFDPGRIDALQKLIERKDGREFHFYHTATLDGMVKRIESFTRNRDPAKAPALHKVVETFEGHEARLNYRSITFEVIDAGHDAPLLKQQIEHPRKIAHKFDRELSAAADHDLAKKTFLTGMRPPRIHLQFHYGEGRITCATRTYTTEKTPNGDNFTVQEYVVDPFAKAMRFTEQRDEYLRLVADEKAAIGDFRDAEREAEKIRDARDKEEKHVELNKSLLVQLQEKKQLEATKPKEEESDVAHKYDYLAPYLPKLRADKGKALSKQDAQAVKDACLKALKERLIDRAHIIETRLEEDQAALTKRQVGYQRQDKDKASDDEEYEKFVHDAQFRIQILKQRRDRHEDIAKQKFKEMIERLQNDPRLAILNQ